MHTFWNVHTFSAFIFGVCDWWSVFDSHGQPSNTEVNNGWWSCPKIPEFSPCAAYLRNCKHLIFYLKSVIDNDVCYCELLDEQMQQLEFKYWRPFPSVSGSRQILSPFTFHVSYLIHNSNPCGFTPQRIQLLANASV